jgi:ribosome biogenesis GTPase
MSPKFRGGSDDWMDDESESSGPRGSARPKKGAPKATFLPADRANATVAEVFPKQCRIKLDVPETGLPAEFLCSYRRASVFGGTEEVRERTPVAVGDRVLATRSSPDSGVIEGVCERRNRLMRRAPGRTGAEADKMQHVLAANVDAVVVVASLKSPDFSPGLVDRFLVGAQAVGIEPIVCVTKMDIWNESDGRPWQIYADLGFRVCEVSVRTGLGMNDLRDAVSGRQVVFCGRSGAGKTSLLNVLLGSEVGRVGEVSELTGKGKHTTTSAILLGGPSNSFWIDTPGVREFGLAELPIERLSSLFPEFNGVKCENAGCLHENEPGCKAVGLSRHASYLRILESVRSGEG